MGTSPLDATKVKVDSENVWIEYDAGGSGNGNGSGCGNGNGTGGGSDNGGKYDKEEIFGQLKFQVARPRWSIVELTRPRAVQIVLRLVSILTN